MPTARRVTARRITARRVTGRRVGVSTDPQFPTIYNYLTDSFRAAGSTTTFDAAHSTWGRLSAATRWTSAQLLEEVASDVARFDHVPSSGVARGLLLEDARTNSVSNHLVQTNELLGSIARDNNAAGAPDGTATATRLYLSGGVDGAVRGVGSDCVSDVVDSHTIYYKPETIITDGGSALLVFAAASRYNFVIDLTDNTARTRIYPSTPVGTTDTDVPVVALKDGWYKVAAPVRQGADTQRRIILEGGDGCSIFVFGAQAEIESAEPTSSILTTGSTATRATENLATTSAIIDPIAEDTLYWEMEATGAGDLITIGATTDHTVTATAAGIVKIAARLGASGAVAINGTVTSVDLSGFTGWSRASNPQMWLRRFVARGETLDNAGLEALSGASLPVVPVDTYSQFDLNYAEGVYWEDGEYRTLAEVLDFTREGDGAYWDDTGTLQTAGTDVLRFDHDPATGEFRGVLVEQGENPGVEYLAGSAATLLVSTGVGDNWGSYSYDSGSSGSNRCLVVSVGRENSVLSPTGITYGGVALTLQETITAVQSDGFSETIDIWTLTNPPTGTNTLDLLGATENDRDGAIFAAVYTGVDQSNPVGSTATDSAPAGTEATSVSINKTSEDDGVVWAFCYDRGLHEFTEVADNTMLFAVETDAQDGRASSFGFGYRLTGDGAVLAGADRTGGETGSEDNGVVAVELLSDAGPLGDVLTQPFSENSGTLRIVGEHKDGDGVLWQADDGTENNRHRIEVSGGNVIYRVTAGGTEQAAITLGALSSSGVYKVAVRFDTNDIAGSLDGATAVTNTTANIPTVTTARFGADTVGVERVNWYKTTTFYDSLKTDAGLEALTNG